MSMIMREALLRMRAKPDRPWSEAAPEYHRMMAGHYGELRRCIANRRKEGKPCRTTHEIVACFVFAEPETVRTPGNITMELK